MTLTALRGAMPRYGAQRRALMYESVVVYSVQASGASAAPEPASEGPDDHLSCRAFSNLVGCE
jgi:hypothetical protein